MFHEEINHPWPYETEAIAKQHDDGVGGPPSGMDWTQSRQVAQLGRIVGAQKAIAALLAITAWEAKRAASWLICLTCVLVVLTVGLVWPELIPHPFLRKDGQKIDAPMAQGPITFASEARRGFHAVFDLKPNLPVSELHEAIRSVQYQNLTSASPSDGFTLGVFIGAAARFNSDEFSDEDKAEASKLAHGYAQTILMVQKTDVLTDNDMERLCPLGYWPIVRELAKQK